ncbi:MAG: ATP-dependent zinc metalloprotease FtsH, partial [Verrucomicrobiaceae bacterium]|nr:ATP-dependent zinc metalloprotease FtsH [Verrucomicrobiaceae bacterium]
MSDDLNGNRSEGPGRRTQDPQFNWRGFMLFIVAAMLLSAGYIAHTYQSRPISLNYREFKTEVEANNISTAKETPLELFRSDTTREEYIQGSLLNVDRLQDRLADKNSVGMKGPAQSGPYLFRVPVNVEFQKDDLNKLLAAHSLVINSKQ